MEESNTNWQFEPPGSCAARVQKEHAIPLLYRRLMGMAAYDRMKAGRTRVQVELVDIVNHKERELANPDPLSLGQLYCPSSPVDISPDCYNWRDSPQSCKNLRLTNIPRVDDQLNAFKDFNRLRPHQPMGI